MVRYIRALISNSYSTLCKYLTVLAFGIFPAEAEIKIMCLGDSITSSRSGYNSYRYELWNKLVRDGYKDKVDFIGRFSKPFDFSTASMNGVYATNQDWDMDHEGRWGARIDDFIKKHETWIRGHNADIVLIHLGTYDILKQNDPVDYTAIQMRNVINKLRSTNPSVVILLAKIIPFTHKLDRVIAFNKTLPKLVNELANERSPVYLVDQFTGYDPATDNIKGDGILPSEKGALKMANKWYEILKPVLDGTAPIVHKPVIGAYDLVGSKVDDSTIHLAWHPPNVRVKEYRIFMGRNPRVWQLVQTVAGHQIEATLSGRNEVNPILQVQAIRHDGEVLPVSEQVTVQLYGTSSSIDENRPSATETLTEEVVTVEENLETVIDLNDDVDLSLPLTESETKPEIISDGDELEQQVHQNHDTDPIDTTVVEPVIEESEVVEAEIVAEVEHPIEENEIEHEMEVDQIQAVPQEVEDIEESEDVELMVEVIEDPTPDPFIEITFEIRDTEASVTESTSEKEESVQQSELVELTIEEPETNPQPVEEISDMSEIDSEPSTPLIENLQEKDVQAQVAHSEEKTLSSANLTGWWKLEEISGAVVKNEVEGGATGTLYGTIFDKSSSFGVGNSGNSLFVNGKNNYIEFDDTKKIHDNNFSVSIWVHRKDIPYDKEAEGLVGKFGQTIGSFNYSIDWHLYINHKGYAMALLTSADGKEWIGVQSIEKISSLAWHHFAVTYDQNVLRLYQNGVLQEEKFTTIDIGQEHNFRINDNGGDRDFKGRVDEVQLYNYALSSADVQSIYHQFAPGEIDQVPPVATEITPEPDLNNQDGEQVASFEPVRLEAEDAWVSGAVAHGKFVDYINPSDDFIEWEVEAKEGNYNLEFLYGLNKSSRYLDIIVNGIVVKKDLEFVSTGNIATYRTIDILAQLKNGTNTIRAIATGTSGPNMNALLISQQ